MAREIYISTDIEADGPIPGPHSMLSFGSAAFLQDRTLHSTFSANLHTLPGAQGHPETMAWWEQHPDAYAASRTDLQDPADAMRRYVQWLEELPGKPVFVAFPVTYDFMFVHWYLMRFVGRSPFSHSGLDLKTWAMVLMDVDFRSAAKRRMPQRWFEGSRHSHVALGDAIEQGVMLGHMLDELAALRKGMF